MVAYISVFILQVIYTIVRFVNVRYIVDGSLFKKLLITTVSSLVWIVTLAIGVGGIIKQDYWIILPFILGAAVGVVIEHYLRKEIKR